MVQEVWLVGLISFLAVMLLVGFVGLVCVRRKQQQKIKMEEEGKNLMGHYNGKHDINDSMSVIIFVTRIKAGSLVVDERNTVQLWP